MLPDRVSNPGPLTYESGALPIALRGPAYGIMKVCSKQREFELMSVYGIMKVCSKQREFELMSVYHSTKSGGISMSFRFSLT